MRQTLDWQSFPSLRRRSARPNACLAVLFRGKVLDGHARAVGLAGQQTPPARDGLPTQCAQSGRREPPASAGLRSERAGQQKPSAPSSRTEVRPGCTCSRRPRCCQRRCRVRSRKRGRDVPAAARPAAWRAAAVRGAAACGGAPCARCGAFGVCEYSKQVARVVNDSDNATPRWRHV
jgi:hypothetical protein